MVLGILLTSPLDCNIIPCLFQLNFVLFFFRYVFFSSLIPSFSIFTASKRIQNSFTTIRQVLDVFFILIFLSYSYLQLFTVPYLHLIHYTYLRLFIYTYVLFFFKEKYGECRNYDKSFQIKEYFQYFQVIVLLLQSK